MSQQHNQQRGSTTPRLEQQRTWHDATPRCDTTRPGTTWHDTTRHDTTQATKLQHIAQYPTGNDFTYDAVVVERRGGACAVPAMSAYVATMSECLSRQTATTTYADQCAMTGGPQDLLNQCRPSFAKWCHQKRNRNSCQAFGTSTRLQTQQHNASAPRTAQVPAGLVPTSNKMWRIQCRDLCNINCRRERGELDCGAVPLSTDKYTLRAVCRDICVRVGGVITVRLIVQRCP